MIIALSLALVVGSNVAVAGASYDSYRASSKCVLSGGRNGFGYVRMKVIAEEYGLSGINQMRFIAFLMRSSKKNGPWTPVSHFERETDYFPNTGKSNAWYQNARWDFGRESKTKYHRIEMFVEFWDLDGRNRIVATTRHLSSSC
jgi:hypothetical protein